MTRAKKKVSVIITEYWDISHADVIITKMIEGFRINGIPYTSSLEIVSMYVDQFPENDISRGIAAKHGIPMYETIEETLLCGGKQMDIEGIIIIGEHGEYPQNEYDQVLYPRRQFFEKCLQLMLKHDHIVPVFSDKGYAIVKEDIEWMYDQITEHNIPFMSSSSIPFAFQKPCPPPIPSGASLHKMFGFSFGPDVDRYAYHTMEMLQSVAERRAYGETGVASVIAYEGEEAIKQLFGPRWQAHYRTLGGYINVTDIESFPQTLDRPIFIEVNYADGLQAGILHADKEINRFVSSFQITEQSQLYYTEYDCQWQKPYTHAAIFVLEIERFIHTGRALFPIERSLITAGVTDAVMKSLYMKKEIETDYLKVSY